MVIPEILIQIAWVFIIARCGYKAINLINVGSKAWFDIGFYISVVIVSFSFLL
ncbi:hypothetical protein [Salipaludibacillus daqingensis]|uniref:hypothetical protein n=1 Tax=Salipaludibacillus daqingensis TaxID=3041001 RepID=UPI002476D090|nr:hypothetical protein [Salipaludibacillus daqingensis]